MSITNRANEQERFGRLPKWAQGIIQRQQNTINGLRKELRSAVRPATDDDELVFDSWHYEDKALPTDMALPRGKVTVRLGKDEYNRKHELDIRVEQDYHGHKSVHVTANYGPLRITPKSSNIVTITSLRNRDN